MIQVIFQIKKIVRLLKRENIPRLLLFTLLTLLIGTFGLYLLEQTHNSNVSNILDAVWWSFVTMTTVGYGDISPVTPGGRLVAILVMLMGIGFLGMFTATIASILIENKLRKDRGLKTTTMTNHTIICGWNYRARDIIEEIRADKEKRDMPIVLLADIEANPVDDDNLFFVKGEVSEESLTRANVAKARNVIIVADDKLEPRSRDAKNILNTLTVESMNSDTYTCVEIEDANNAAHCRRARANEIIVSGDFSSKLLARAAMHHGISKFIDELLSSRYGSDLFKCPVTPKMVGQKFLDIFIKTKADHNATIVAIDSENNNVFISNPPQDYVIQDYDHLIIISNQKPAFD